MIQFTIASPPAGTKQNTCFKDHLKTAFPYIPQTLIQGIRLNNHNTSIFSYNWIYSTAVLKILGWTCPFNNFQNCKWTRRLVFRKTTMCLAA